MNKNSKLSINITNDEKIDDDFLCVWDIFGSRPNKLSFYSSFNIENINELTKGYNIISQSKDIISDSDIYVINTKKLINIKDTIYIQYIEVIEIFKDEEVSSDSYVSSVTILYKDKDDETIVSQFETLLFKSEIVDDIIEENNVESKIDLRILKYDNNENKFSSIPNESKLNIDSESIELYYNESIFKSTKKLIKGVNKHNKGISIICGERGLGKTSLLYYLSLNLKKKVIFIPPSYTENILFNAEFIDFLKNNTNTVFIIDDTEHFFLKGNTKGNNSITNLLYLTDGILSDSLNVHFIIGMNIQKSSIDETLMESNNILEVIEINKLNKKSFESLSDHLGLKTKYTQDTKLVNVLKEKVEHNKSIGF